MKYAILSFLITFSQILYSQEFNVKDYGAKGDSKTDDTSSFIKAINDIKSKYSNKKIQALLYIPSGTYILNGSITINKYISINGEFVNNTILKTNNLDNTIIVSEKNFNEADIYSAYNYIKNLTLLGPESTKSYLAERSGNNRNQNSAGIRIYGLRTMMQDLHIEGFSNYGIQISGSYYNYIQNCFIRNNAIGIGIDEISTSTFVNNNEIRHNSIGILIKGKSFANFITNNMIENNLATYLNKDSSIQKENLLTAGRAIILDDSNNNFINNNYLEEHYINFSLNNANKNNIENNFTALGSKNIKISEAFQLQIQGNSKNNLYQKNTSNGDSSRPDTYSMLLGDENYSTNTVDFTEKNQQLKDSLLKNYSRMKDKLPKIPDN